MRLFFVTAVLVVLAVSDIGLAGPGQPPLRVLYAPAADMDQAFQDDLATVANAMVEYFDARADTPPLDYILTFDAVFTWRENGETYAQPGLFGDLLAGAADQARCIVLGYGCAMPGGLSGFIMSSSYCPVANPSGTNNILLAHPDMGTTCIWTGGPVVPSMNANQHENLVTQLYGVVDGTWIETGEIAAAFMDVNLDGVPADPPVIYLNGARSGSGTDIPCWIAGAFRCHHVEPPDCPEDLTGDSIVSTEDLLALLSLWGEPDPQADFDGSGQVDTADLLTLLAGWGDCNIVLSGR